MSAPKTRPVHAPHKRTVSVPDNQYGSINIRKIDNGYITSKSMSGPKGYSSSESFSPTKPEIEFWEEKQRNQKAAPKPSGSFGAAAKELSRKA